MNVLNWLKMGSFERTFQFWEEDKVKRSVRTVFEFITFYQAWTRPSQKNYLRKIITGCHVNVTECGVAQG